MTMRSWPEATGLPSGSVSTSSSTPLTEGWTLRRTEAGELETPVALSAREGATRATVPGTVASAMGPRPLDGHEDYDQHDWWYSVDLEPHSPTETQRVRLRFDGLATLAQAWIDDTPILESSNMFVSHVVDITDLVREGGRLSIVFRSLARALTKRRPRPRWKTNLVHHQQLRWFRTTLLGRIPGWTPPIRPVGPWRPIWLEVVDAVDLRSLSLTTEVRDADGIVRVDAALAGLSPQLVVEKARAVVGGVSLPLDVRKEEDHWRVWGEARVERPELWWPRTHGEPTLHATSLHIRTSEGPCVVDCGEVGFRSLEVDRSGDGIEFVVNDVPVFVRGACWTTDDIVTLHGDPDRMRRTLGLLSEAHGNMVRVGGTMVYERDDFYRTCDRLGILVWQDFMFANMHYPVDDHDFSTSIAVEAAQQIRRLAKHPCVAAYCGGSEVEQQAAMFGAPRALWTNSFFATELPGLVEEGAPGAPYWPSTPTGGGLPFHVGDGLTHYYGVGAYRRPLEDVRLANVQLTPECLGFSNVPEESNQRKVTAEGTVPHHHPAWKTGIPRDTGAGWDFEDIRDFYLELLYDVDAVKMRSQDPAEYDRLSRVVTGRVMDHVYQEWRAGGCGGGLVWFLKDLRPGAGWGIIDSDNHPKPVYYFLKRAWAPFAVSILDRGLDGLRIVLHNESDRDMEARVELAVVNRQSTPTARASTDVMVGARTRTELSSDSLLDHFTDPTYSYRFGARGHEAVCVTVTSRELDEPLTRIYWPELSSSMLPPALDAKLDADARRCLIAPETLARDVRLEGEGWVPADNYFDLVPGTPRTVVLRTHGPGDPGALYIDVGGIPSLVDVP